MSKRKPKIYFSFALAIAISLAIVAQEVRAAPPEAAIPTNAAFATAAPASNEVLQVPVDTIDLRNGDRLYGKLLAIDPQSSVRWQHPDAAQTIEFKMDSVAQIDFPAQRIPATHFDAACRVHLAGANQLEGNLISCDPQSLVLDTWYAGKLTIARNAIQNLSISTPANTEFDGITTMDGWTQGTATAAFIGESGQWIYRNGAFYANKPASIARNLSLPDQAQIEFDLTWKGALNLAIALYTDSLQPILLNNKENGPDFGGFYSLQIQSVFMQLRRVKKQEPLAQSSLGDLVVPSLSQSNRVHMDLRCSKPQHSVSLLIDGALIKQWIDTNGFAGEGKGVRFVQNPPGGSVKISNLRVSQWDGVLQEGHPAEVDPARDTAWLNDGTTLAGTIDTITGGKMTIQIAREKRELPISKLREITFARSRPVANANESDAAHMALTRASFAQGGTVMFDLDNWTSNTISVHSSAFGPAKFNPAAFVRLQFLQTTGGANSPATPRPNGFE